MPQQLVHKNLARVTAMDLYKLCVLLHVTIFSQRNQTYKVKLRKSGTEKRNKSENKGETKQKRN